MPPDRWKYLATTAEAQAQYRHWNMGGRKAALDPQVLRRLAAQEQAGRLELRLRAAFHAMHAKVYLWQTADKHWRGISGSSNLTQSGLSGSGEFNSLLMPAQIKEAHSWFQIHWQSQQSRPAPQAWAGLRAICQEEAAEAQKAATASVPTTTTRPQPAVAIRPAFADPGTVKR